MIADQLKIGGWAIAVMLVLCGALVVVAQAPIAIGIVREDGNLFPITLIPVTEITDSRFPRETSVNGVVSSEPESPIWPLKDRAWTLAGGRGLRPMTIKTIEPVMVQMPYGEDRMMWRTTLQRPPARKGYAPILKIGAAVSGGSLEFPENVTRQPDEVSRRVARRIVSLFAAKEKARLSEHRFYEVSADSLPIVIKVLTRHTAAGVTTYYFEATRSVPNSLGAVVPDLGLLTGWIAETASELRDFEVTFKINDDASKQNERAIVRGIIPYKGKAFWLLEWHGWESEYYTVHDWPSGRLVVTVEAYK